MIQQQKRSQSEEDDEGRDPSILLALKRFRCEKQNTDNPPSMFHPGNEDHDDGEREGEEEENYGGEREVDESNLNEEAMMEQVRCYNSSSRIMISVIPSNMLDGISEPLFPSGDMPCNVVFNNNPNTSVQSNLSGPSLSMRSRTESLYPWLLVINEPCHSEKQVASGKDLSGVKKKYKRMFCVYCAEHNPHTPWAQWKARKFEKENLDDHERSIHHQKTLLAREKVGLMNSIVPPAESFQTMNMMMPMGESSGISLTPLMSSSFQLPLLSKLTEHDLVAMEHGGKEITNQHQHGTGSLINRVAIANSLIPTINMPMGELSDDLHLVPNAHPYPGHAMPNSGMMALYPYPSSLIPGTSSPSQTFLDTVYNAALRPRSKYAPDWLRVQGKLSFSDRQRDGNKDLSKAKKKYKLVMCAYCAEFNPSAPWATMRYRKFETAVLLEHEKSSFHKKARELRDRVHGLPNSLCDLSRWEVSESSCNSLTLPPVSP